MQRAPVGSVNKTPLQCLTATSGSHKTHDQPHTLPAPPLPSPQTFHEPHLRTSPIFTPPAALAPPAHGTVARRPKRSRLVPTRGNRPDVAKKESGLWRRHVTLRTPLSLTGAPAIKSADHEQLPARHRQARQDLDLAAPRTRILAIFSASSFIFEQSVWPHGPNWLTVGFSFTIQHSRRGLQTRDVYNEGVVEVELKIVTMSAMYRVPLVRGSSSSGSRSISMSSRATAHHQSGDTREQGPIVLA